MLDPAADGPGDAVRLGIAYVPEDRRRHGVIPELSIAVNTTLASLQKITTRGLLDAGKEQRITAGYVKRLSIKAPSIDTPVERRLIVDLAEQGLAILLISSDLPEILGMSDRVAVMRSRTIVGTLDRSGATPESILALALGHDS